MTAVRHFSILLSSTRRGARLARRLTVQQLTEWGHSFATAEQIVAELAANAALHGRVPGRDFRLTLTVGNAGTLRIEVTDARADRRPQRSDCPEPDAESGRGLLLVEALADRWGVDDGPAPCKTAWAEIDRPASL
ncbi:ATP-binding protein [Streptomyces sp. NBC_01481]|uniref:ATP-binding protein n=1 Tax=Streptomyces sp. NBC_01481 TaxID=2975869 RepID=UPI0022593F06|nr:ATP-binding protein [Streptomyces sp. NBC_01481]MCX4582624.1 ATP-binding protein [Streptomyces sp. NBC_01481]